MAKLQWDIDGQHYYETGTKDVVLYVWQDDTTATASTAASGAYCNGVSWSGVTSLSESPSGADETALYADDTKYLSLRALEEFGATIEAYTYPDEWAVCDGSAIITKTTTSGSTSSTSAFTFGQQSRRKFALSFVTTVGNDTMGDAFGEKIHIIYGCTASPSDRSYQSINDSPEAITFSWEISTTPLKGEYVTFGGTTYRAMSQVAIESARFTGGTDNATYKLIKNTLQGVDGVAGVFVQTSDSTAASGKTYYARSGQGTTESPYTYAVETNVTGTNIASLYEATTAPVEEVYPTVIFPNELYYICENGTLPTALATRASTARVLA